MTAESLTGQDDLTRPLGHDTGAHAAPGAAARRERGVRARVSPVALIGGVGLLLLVALTGYVAIARDPLGGEPVATAPITVVAAPAGAAPQRADIGPAEAPALSREASTTRPTQRQSAGEMEEDAGVRVVRPGGAQAPASVVIRVPDQAPAIRMAPAPDRRLVERGRHGALPKIGADGARSADIYARPLTAIQRQAAIRVAIVIGGLGVSQHATQEAIKKLPPSVSLAFAPYGSDLERQVARAREDGHEVLLHLPMEPFDYPDNDPGPQTLLSSLPAEQNRDRLHWLLSRFPGFIGVVNYMGAKLTATEPALSPVIKEVGDRGLLWLDDGSSGRSLAPRLAAGLGLSAARTDIVIDAVQRAGEIDAALQRLEDAARRNGSAVGMGSALPVTVERVQRWARAAESRGVILVPVSAIAATPRRS
jgi:hypothetical protein